MKYKSLGTLGGKPVTHTTETKTGIYGSSTVQETRTGIYATSPHHVEEENKLRAILEAPIEGNVWEVICVVTRHKGDDEKKARAAYKEYVEKSDMGYGRIGHEPVLLYHDGKVVESHTWAGPKLKADAAHKQK